MVGEWGCHCAQEIQEGLRGTVMNSIFHFRNVELEVLGKQAGRDVCRGRDSWVLCPVRALGLEMCVW